MAFSEETIQQVWEKATPVAGNDPACLASRPMQGLDWKKVLRK